MVELHEIKKENGKFRINYKRTVKDIADNDVIVPAASYLKSKEELLQEITHWESQKQNAEYYIAKLKEELKEVEKIE